MPSLALIALPGRLAVCRLEPDAPLPAPLADAPFWSATRTADELSLVIPEEAVPPTCSSKKGFRALKISGTLDFALTGILASIALPLAEAGIAIFVLSTYDTDTILIQEEDFDAAITTLEGVGHRVERRG